MSEHHVFTFTWSIRNFSRCAAEENDFINSPNFEIECLKGTRFYMIFYPKGDGCQPGYCSLYFGKVQVCVMDVLVDLQIRLSNGTFKRMNYIRFLGSDLTFGFSPFLPVNHLTKEGAYLNDDTLTLRCQLWNESHNLHVPISCYAQTRIKISKLYYTWSINDLVESNKLALKNEINQMVKVPNYLPEVPNFDIIHSNKNDNDIIQLIIINSNNNKRFLLMYTILLCVNDGKIVDCVMGQFMSKKRTAEQILNSAFLSKQNLMLNQKLLLPDGKLQCEFSVSTKEYELEALEYGENEDVYLKCVIPNQVPFESDEVLKQKALWKENQKQLFKKGEFSDIIIRTPGREFPVHRAVLSAHSEVFCAMLHHDMKEQNTGVIDINDMEDDAVDKMLAYLYTGAVEDMDCPIAQKLYFAADKYDIVGLLKKCSNFLMANLDASNVCAVLVLADAHQDEQLKESGMDFIVEHESEIVDSEDWEKLMETHGSLTNVTMKTIICKNRKKKVKLG